jgi:hypothetical protein
MMRWDNEPADPLRDLQSLLPPKPQQRPALLVSADLTDAERAELRQMFVADHVQMSRVAPRPSVLRVPIEQFGESDMMQRLRRDAEHATRRALFRF